MLKSIDNYQVEVLLTLAAVMGGYALASHLHVPARWRWWWSGWRWPIADSTRHHVDMFWELIDEMLNAVLFVLIGMEVLLISFSGPLLLGAALSPSA